ncbi:hypothetical protein, partial [Trabulsiella odontotermitis]|uniref:hypothetical protein n=1 Tax=Trabulsiella odontotermitis TaxID=379893 RepID=UPI001EDDB092
SKHEKARSDGIAALEHFAKKQNIIFRMWGNMPRRRDLVSCVWRLGVYGCALCAGVFVRPPLLLNSLWQSQ